MPKNILFRYAGLFHMVDILPTMLSLAASKNTDFDLDGVDHVESLLGQSPSPRKLMVYNIDNMMVPSVLSVRSSRPHFQMALRQNNYKLIWGDAKMLHRYLSNSILTTIAFRDPDTYYLLTRGYRERHANFQQVLELYDLNKDPLEKHNIADKLPEMVKKLQRLGLDMYR